jgi:autotransporter strand-loop-strand O-heptosyltransferase
MIEAVKSETLAEVTEKSSRVGSVEPQNSSLNRSSAPRESAYPSAAATPTLEGPDGIRFDFNEGCRVILPARETGVWLARLRDLDTGNILFETETKGGLIRSAKRWFVRFGIEVWARDDEGVEPRLVLEHVFDAAGKEILIQFPVGTLGDSIAWFSYACRFTETHPGARVVCVMSEKLIPLFQNAYRDLIFTTFEEAAERRLSETAYATYRLGLFFTDRANEWQPADFRHVGLHKTAAHILGVDACEEPPRLSLPDESRPIKDPYAVIAVQATSAAKMWNNPNGWREVIAHLKARGFRVLCIDQKPVSGQGLYWTQIPHGCEDFTGLPLTEAARYLRHAELFVGLSSGLSWLAWAAGCKTVLISGFSLPSTEFVTPGRVINWHTCNGCWNDMAFVFDHDDFLWCPRHAGTPRQFECTRLITPAHVMRAIDKTLQPSA